MADSTSNLDLLTSLKEPAANALFDAISPAVIYARRPSRCAGLKWAYYGGRFNSVAVSPGTLTLEASATNYIVGELSGGEISADTDDTNWNDSVNYFRIYLVVTDSDSVTSWQDYRG